MVVFFFQAEDGIRDWSVTGVQTCALPICLRRLRDAGILRGERARRFDVEARVALGGLDELSVRERLTGALEKVRDPAEPLLRQPLARRAAQRRAMPAARGLVEHRQCAPAV